MFLRHVVYSRGMKRQIRTISIAVLVALALLAGWYTTVAAVEMSTGTNVVGPFNFQPLVSEPLDTLRKVEAPALAIPIWLEGGR